MRRHLLSLALPVAFAFGLGVAGAGAPPKKPEEKPASGPTSGSGQPPASAGAPAAAVPKGEMAHADLKGRDGKSMGTATLEQTPNGVLINANLEHLAPGMHAFHIHDTGKCDGAAGFKSAGGHFNPEAHQHGLKNPAGLHAGDLPNIDAGADGKARFQFFAHGVTLEAGKKNSLLDADGSALVVHDKADDLASDPAGAAGDRIACGVVEKDAKK